jgi:Putative transposase DNA-binding domain
VDKRPDLGLDPASADITTVLELARDAAHGVARPAEQKAAASGVLVLYVDPKHTSQERRQCGHVASSSRESQAVFRCVACGHEDHADANAARESRP